MSSSIIYAPRTMADLTDEPTEPHLIQNVCRETGSILLYGKTGIGKTRLVWQFACGWSRGEDALGLVPLRPLRIVLVEADMFRQDFEAVVRDYRNIGHLPHRTLAWFSRDDTIPFNVTGTFGDALRKFNIQNETDLVIYDAIPDLHMGDSNDPRTASQTLQALHYCANGRAYLGILVQRKGSRLDAHETTETVDEMLGSQAWSRQASTIWQMTNVPSLVWVKHRLCQKPKSIELTIGPDAVFYLKSGQSHGLLQKYAAQPYPSVRELVRRVMADPAYAKLASVYGDRKLQEIAANEIKLGHIPAPCAGMPAHRGFAQPSHAQQIDE